jgi:hypothetical protein
MGIPPDQRGHFTLWLITVLGNEWRHPADSPATIAAQSALLDSRIASATRTLIRLLKQRDELLDRKMAETNGAFLRHVRAPARGRRRKNSSRFERFVEYLLYVACAVGGHATFNRRTGKGNIVEVLDELRPHLPSGFIPKSLHSNAAVFHCRCL